MRRVKICPRCKLRPNKPTHGWCAECVNERARATRKKHRELDHEAKAKATTRAYSGVLKARGRLVPEACACGSTEVQMHHPDYRNPRRVIWTCEPCHRQHHADERSGKAAADRAAANAYFASLVP